MMTYVVIAGSDFWLFSKLKDARKQLAHEIKEHWEECIKYSCPKKEFYDDSYRTLSQCLHDEMAIINHKEYKLIRVPSQHVVIE